MGSFVAHDEGGFQSVACVRGDATAAHYDPDRALNDLRRNNPVTVNIGIERFPIFMKRRIGLGARIAMKRAAAVRNPGSNLGHV